MAIINGTKAGDFLTGTQDGDTIFGRGGDDTITGGRGNDFIDMGRGDDIAVWDPGDGSDTILGGKGFDTLVFNGANVNEKIDISAIDGVTQLTRDVGGVTMALDSVERIALAVSGGTDLVHVGDLSHSATTQVAIDLGAQSGLGGDGAADTVVVDGLDGKDHIQVGFDENGQISVGGLHAAISVANAEAVDTLVLNGLDGNDTIDASALAAGGMALTIDGGAGNDMIFGSAGADLVFGGDGNDTATGGKGADTVSLGDGNDVFNWQLGDGSDMIDGGTGFDTLNLTGGGGDMFQLLANGAHVGITVSDGAVLNVTGMEQINVAEKGNGNAIVVGDLSGTDVTGVSIDLGAGSGCGPGGGKDDTVTVDSAMGEVMSIASQSGTVTMTDELNFQSVVIEDANATDTLMVNGSAGNDVIDASGLAATSMVLQVNAGDGNDLIFGSAGDDLINGGRGSDVALMGAGNDTYVWNPGDGSDSIDGQAGFDTLLFNGSNAPENYDILALGSHAELTRDVGAVTMNLNSVERIALNTLGSADNVHIHDLTNSGVKQVAVDLSATLGGHVGDGAHDTVTAEGTNGNDHITVSSNANGIHIAGMAADITIANAESTDSILVNGGGGNDTIDATGFQPGAGALSITGGAGNDTINLGHADTTINYTSVLDGHDVIEGFASGHDTINLTKLFDSLGIAAGDRAGDVSIVDHGNGTVDVAVNGGGFNQVVTTVHTHDHLAVGTDVHVNG